MPTQNFFLEDFIQTLEFWGLRDVMLPFLLIFTIVFAVLEKSQLLGEDKKNLNIIVAIVFALLTVIPHVTRTYPGNFDPVQIINDAIPAVSIVVVAIIALLILVGLFGQEKIFLGMSMPGWIAFLSLMTILLIFGSAAGWWLDGWPLWLERFFGHDAIAIIIMLLTFGLIIAFITGSSKEREDRTILSRMGMDFKKLFSGGGKH